MSPPELALSTPLLTRRVPARDLPQERPALEPAAPDVSAALCQLLKDFGVGAAFGLTGGAFARCFDALSRSGIPVVHCRHESGAAFAATEAYFASGKPSVVFTTTGPGVTNAITGLLAARNEGAKVILISAATAAPSRGRGACQETSAHSLPGGIYESGPLFHFATLLEHPRELETVAAKLASGLGRPGGFVAHVALPTSLQSSPASRLRPQVVSLPSGVTAEAVERCAAILREGPFVIWAGFGARHAAPLVRELAERFGAPVMCSPRAKGLFPERHPLYLGITGLGGHPTVDAHFASARPRTVLVLGTRLGEPTSYWQPELLPSGELVHVDVDPSAFGAAYPTAKTLGVPSEIGAFLRALLERLPPGALAKQPPPRALAPPESTPLRASGPVRAEALFAAIQRRVVEGSSATVLTECGNAFAWGNQLLRFSDPNRYRVSVGFGSMGHATTGVMGTAMGLKGKAVAVVGDGSMLMNSELSTAVAHQIPAVWVVMNDAGYGMVRHGMDALGFAPPETDIPDTDFALVARGMGSRGVTVRTEAELDAALDEAMAASGPFVVDVKTDRNEAGPWIKRIHALILQGAEAKKGRP